MIVFELAYYRLPFEERMSSTFDHDRRPITEEFTSFDDERNRADDPCFDDMHDITISEHDPEIGFIESWKVQS